MAVLGGLLMCVDTISSDSSESKSAESSVDRPPTVIGDCSAFTGAVFLCGYLLIGKEMRKSLPVFRYMTSVVLVAAIVCTIFSLLLEEGTRIFPDNGDANLAVFGFFFNLRFFLVALFLGAGAGVGGHTLVNWCLAYLSPLVVGSALLLEPLIGGLVGLCLGMQGKLGVWTLIGGLFCMAGLQLVLKGENNNKGRLLVIRRSTQRKLKATAS
eukprot:gnl/MRDRNA2_/MRDRNA2_264290_c0_seq1.p1 gnl/MRDRNA2_/MRDRNA2_264290_c0~~gnl/MRDRNA2_/MRDRNA2_264290_c0_seq1.p1  ORF type:complete len:226 (+),score=5.35 gnl/MRDRNA2_/MRDRNA2_264290_c0_seq1:43-678(+)